MTRTILTFPDSTCLPLFRLIPDTSISAGPFHDQLRVENLDKLLNTLREEGVEVAENVEDCDHGNRMGDGPGGKPGPAVAAEGSG